MNPGSGTEHFETVPSGGVPIAPHGVFRLCEHKLGDQFGGFRAIARKHTILANANPTDHFVHTADEARPGLCVDGTAGGAVCVESLKQRALKPHVNLANDFNVAN